MIAGWTTEGLLREVLDAPRRGLIPRSDTQVISRPDWYQLLTPSLKQGGLNEIGFARMDAEEADTIIDATIAQYRDRGMRFRWTVPPGSKPDDLAARLERRGFVRSETAGMYRETSSLGLTPDPDVTIEIVTVQSEPVFTRTVASGWGMDPAPLTDYHRMALAHPHQRSYLARYRGEPAGVAGFIASERSAYLINGMVLPEFRRRGIFRVLVGALLDGCRERGIALATTHARADTSAPLIERLGFETIARFPVMVWQP